MSQNALVVPNTGTLSGLTMVNDLNALADSLNTCNSGAAAPASAAANSLWVDTTNGITKQRDQGNTTWNLMDTTDVGLIVGKSANYTLVLSDFMSYIIATNTMTFTLPPAATVGPRWRVKIGNGSTQTSPLIVNVQRQGSDSIDIDSATSIYLCAGDCVEFFSDGVLHWWTRGRTTLIEKRGSGFSPATGLSNSEIAVSFPVYPRLFTTVLGCVICGSGYPNNTTTKLATYTVHTLDVNGFDALAECNGLTTFNLAPAFYWYAWGV